MMEFWAPIKGYEGRYEISSLGRVKSLPNRVHKTELIMKTNHLHKFGYEMVNLKRSRKDQKLATVHRLVLSAFCCRAPGMEECGHLDGNPKNNRIQNLRWVTKKENGRQRAEHRVQRLAMLESEKTKTEL